MLRPRARLAFDLAVERSKTRKRDIMLRTSSRLSQAARFVSACRHASTSDAAFRLIDPLPNTAQVGQVAPPTERKVC